MNKDLKKSVTLEDLALTLDDLTSAVAAGFENTVSKREFSDLKNEVVEIKNGFKEVEGRLGEVEYSQKALTSKVGNYLELSESRYVELKQRDALLAKWLVLVANKTNTPIDVSQLEKI